MKLLNASKYAVSAIFLFATGNANAQTAPALALSLNQQSLKDLGTCNYILSDQMRVRRLMIILRNMKMFHFRLKSSKD